MTAKTSRNKTKRIKNKFVEYDYESAYSRRMQDANEWFVEQLLKHGKKAVYALKEISAGEQFEIEMYPQFTSMEDVPPEGKKERAYWEQRRAQRELNRKNSCKYVERLINQNFTDGDVWITLTYDDEHLPPDGDIEAAEKDVKNWISRINYRRKKIGLPPAKYIYITEYDPYAKIRWHHHVIMDGAMDMDILESLWKKGHRNESRRLKRDENGLSGMAHYITKIERESQRLKYEKRWHSSKGLIKPYVNVVHSKRPEDRKGNYKKIERYVKEMVKNQNSIPEQLKKWYPDYTFTSAEVYYNEFNYMFYIHARMYRTDKTREGG